MLEEQDMPDDARDDAKRCALLKLLALRQTGKIAGRIEAGGDTVAQSTKS